MKARSSFAFASLALALVALPRAAGATCSQQSTFNPPAFFAAGNARDVALGDFNSDGIVGVAVPTATSSGRCRARSRFCSTTAPRESATAPSPHPQITSWRRRWRSPPRTSTDGILDLPSPAGWRRRRDLGFGATSPATGRSAPRGRREAIAESTGVSRDNLDRRLRQQRSNHRRAAPVRIGACRTDLALDRQNLDQHHHGRLVRTGSSIRRDLLSPTGLAMLLNRSRVWAAEDSFRR